MTTPHPTILDVKLAFLRAQILALSAPLSLPPSYQPAANTPDPPLRTTSIDDALVKLNARLKQHSRVVYSAPAQRHVAEQLDALCWRAGERDVRSGRVGRGEGDGLERGRDLATDRNIAALPSTWDEADSDDDDDDDDDTSSSSSTAQHFATLSARLKSLAERRREVTARVARLKALKEGLRGLEDVRGEVQRNLCTRDGEVEKELERMRVLMARVGGRVGGLEGEKGGQVGVGEVGGKEAMDVDVDMDMEMDEARKLEALLA